jgi:hypothetical protein
VDAEEEQIKDVYAHFGLGAYFGQVFETTLCNLLILDARVRGEVANSAEVDALEVAQQKKTMGALIREFRTRTTLPPNAESIMGTALDRRNFLNHHFFRVHAEDFMSEAGRLKMLTELHRIQESIKEADQVATLLCMALMKFLGITPEIIRAEFEALQERAQGRTDPQRAKGTIMEMKYGQISQANRMNTSIYMCFEHIAEEDARAFVKKFAEQPHDQPQIMHTFTELVLGAFLCREEVPARYDHLIDGQTPDWSIVDGGVKGIVELVNFHTDESTERQIHEAMRSAGIWCDWMASNVNRLYDRIWQKAVAYKELRQRLAIPYAVGVFPKFEAAVEQHEVEECLHHEEYGLFRLYTDLSGVLYFEENCGRYTFRYIPNPAAERPLALPSGVLDLFN